MTTPHQFKPSHQPIKEYYAALEAYRGHEVVHELAVKTAFQRLLEVTARKHDWHLVPEQPTTDRGKSIRPDGTLRDSFNLHRGYWEAKDSGDKLDAEIKSGYPLMNANFENTSSPLPDQNSRDVQPRFDITEPEQQHDLLQDG